MARLHHDVLAGGKPEALLLFTHGIFGSGGNWRSIARAVTARRPTWGAVLVDLRLHGRSDAGDPPHTVAACADDLAALIADLDRRGPPVRAAAGHSFGGKVVLSQRGLAHRFILDSTPSSRPAAFDDRANQIHGAWHSMHALDPARVWARRDDYVAALVARGHTPALSAWLAMNLAPVDGGLRLRFDLPAIRDLVLDYFATDLWPLVSDPTLGALDFLVAEAGNTVSPADVARLRTSPPHVHTTVLPGASHWLHIDSADAVVSHLATALP